MKIEDSFRVEVPVEEAWKVLLDLERIAPCLPGAQLTEVEGDEYRGTVKIKVGPITAQYKGVAKIEEADEANRKVVLQAEGRDTRGQGNASATVVATLVPDGDGTTVNIDTDLNITGKVAQFGRGVMADVSSKLLGQFADNLKQDVLSGDAATARRGRAGDHAAGTGSAGRPRHAPGARRTPASRPPAQPEAGPRKIESQGSRAHRPDGRGRRLGGEADRADRGRVWSWCSRSGRSSSAARSAARSTAGPPRRELTLLGSNPCSIPRREAAGPGHRPGRVALRVRRGARATAALPRRRLRRDPHAAERGAAHPPRHAAARARRADRRVSPPVAVAVERVLFQVNTRTAMSVGQASGLALALAGRAGIPVVHYSPNEVKLAVAGDGGAGKYEVQTMVMRLLQLAEVPEPPDAADALALALCHWWRAPLAAQGAVGNAQSSKLDDAIADGASPRLAEGRLAEGRHERRAMIGSVRGTVIERTAAGEVLVEVGGVGYRAYVPGERAAGAAPRRHHVPLHAPARARGRDGALRVPDARRARHVRGAHRHHRRRAQARAGDAVGALTRRRSGARCSRTTSPRSRWCPASASAPPSGCWWSSRPGSRCPSSTSPRPVAHRAPRAEVRAALAGLGYAPDEVRDVVAQLPDGSVEELCVEDAPPRGAEAPGGDRTQ